MPQNDENQKQAPQQQQPVPPIFELVEIYVHVTEKNNNPAVELRRLTTDIDIIKKIVSAAYHEQPIILLPRFSDKIKSLNSLQQKGIIFFKFEDNQFYFIQ